MIIRKAKTKDAEQLAELYLQFWEANIANPLHEPYFVINYENCLKDAMELVKDKKFKLYVVADNDEVIGFIVFTIKKSYKLFKIKKYGYLVEIVVNKKHRNKGIAVKMLNYALDYFKKKKLKYASCTVEVDNELALEIWQKYGFKKISTELIRELH